MSIHSKYRQYLNRIGVGFSQFSYDGFCSNLIQYINEGANPLITDGRYWNVLHYICAHGNPDNLYDLEKFLQGKEELLKQLLKPNLFGISPRHLLNNRIDAQESYYWKRDGNLQTMVSLFDAIEITAKKSTNSIDSSKDKNKGKTPENISSEGESSSSSQSSIEQNYEEPYRKIYSPNNSVEGLKVYVALWPTRENLTNAEEALKRTFSSQHQQAFAVEILQHSQEDVYPSHWDGSLYRTEDYRGKELCIHVIYDKDKRHLPLTAEEYKQFFLDLWFHFQSLEVDMNYIRSPATKPFPSHPGIYTPFNFSLEYYWLNIFQDNILTWKDMKEREIQNFNPGPISMSRNHYEILHDSELQAWRENNKKPRDFFEEKPKKLENDYFYGHFISSARKKFSQEEWDFNPLHSLRNTVENLKLVLENQEPVSVIEARDDRVLFEKICAFLNTLSARSSALTHSQNEEIEFLRGLACDANLGYSHYHPNKIHGKKYIKPFSLDETLEVHQDEFNKILISLRETLKNPDKSSLTEKIEEAIEKALTLIQTYPINPCTTDNEGWTILDYIVKLKDNRSLDILIDSISENDLSRLLKTRTPSRNITLLEDIRHSQHNPDNLRFFLEFIIACKGGLEKNKHSLMIFQKLLVNCFNAKNSNTMRENDLEKIFLNCLRSMEAPSILNNTISNLLSGLNGLDAIDSAVETHQRRPWKIFSLALHVFVTFGFSLENSKKMESLILTCCIELLVFAKNSLDFNTHKKRIGEVGQSFWKTIAEVIPAEGLESFGQTQSAERIDDLIMLCKKEAAQLETHLQSDCQKSAASSSSSHAQRHPSVSSVL